MSTWHAFLHPLSPLGQGLYGGILGDVSEVTLVWAAVMVWRAHNCHERWCPWVRFKPHPDDGNHLLCRRHHRKAVTPE